MEQVGMTRLDPVIAAVTDRVIERSKPTRQAYLALMDEQREHGVNRDNLSCGNLAHGFAAAVQSPSQIGRAAFMMPGSSTRSVSRKSCVGIRIALLLSTSAASRFGMQILYLLSH